METNLLAQVQAQLKAPKGQFNSFGKYNYRSAEDIVEAVKPLINPHGLHLILSDEVLMVGSRHYVKATASLSNGVVTYTSVGWAREEESKKGMDGSQVTGAASSYARKYALNGLFAIDDTKDSDATNDHGKGEPEPKAKPAAKPAPKPVAVSQEIEQLRSRLSEAVEKYKGSPAGEKFPLKAITYDTLKKNDIPSLKALADCTNPLVLTELIDVLDAAIESSK